jgi:hypothetical protein
MKIFVVELINQGLCATQHFCIAPEYAREPRCMHAHDGAEERIDHATGILIKINGVVASRFVMQDEDGDDGRRVSLH